MQSTTSFTGLNQDNILPCRTQQPYFSDYGEPKCVCEPSVRTQPTDGLPPDDRERGMREGDERGGWKQEEAGVFVSLKERGGEREGEVQEEVGGESAGGGGNRKRNGEKAG